MPHETPKELLRLNEAAPRLFRNACLLGIAGLVVSLLIAVSVDGGVKRAYHSYLMNFCYFLSLSLGGLVFVMIQHLSRAGWSVVVRRISEAVAANVLFLVVLFVPILFGMHHLFPWTREELVASDPLLQWKQPYLNVPFFIIRCLIYFGVWCGLSYFLLRWSQEQDASRSPALTLRMERWSAPGILLFAITVTFASFDLLMSRDPHWFSTIYGVYYFGGSFLGFVSLLPVIFFALRLNGYIRRSVTAEHFHDLGKLMLGFTVFWAYIAFSQFLLIWYADLPEETGWYARRLEGQWGWLSFLLLAGHFIIPFIGLLFRYPKRRLRYLAPWGLFILVMHWLDLYWLSMPEFYWGVEGADTGVIPFHLLDLTTLLGIGGFFLAGTIQWLRDCSLIPEGDPRLKESLSFENA